MSSSPKPTPHRIDASRLPRLRSAAQLLHRPADVRHPADVARAICGAQAQDRYAGRLAFRARSRRLTAADVDHARNEERSLLRTWAMRGTMHLLATDDAGWLVPLFEDAMAVNARRRLSQLGMDAATRDRGIREIERALSADGPLTRSELTERLERKGLPLAPSTRLHLFSLAVVTGMACLGPDQGGRPSLVLTRDWIGERPRHDRAKALTELARRYLRAFGPATETDLAGWAGLGLGEVRAGLAGVGEELTEVSVAGQRAWMPKRAARRPRGRYVRLLPAWDTYLMGYRDRGFVAQPAHWRRIMPGGGMLHPTIVVDGVAVGTWRGRRDRGSIRIEPKLFLEVDRGVGEAIEAEIADVLRFEEELSPA
jgi:Winged helix DNA-binding domain